MTVRKDNLIEQKLEVWKNTQMQVHMDMDFPCHSFATHIILAVRKSGAWTHRNYEKCIGVHRIDEFSINFLTLAFSMEVPQT